ncbi:MAG: hypothetical protein H7Y00_15005, partial [Fimbriimonadaceae bacterium]|nr:hypothetical protein [Chitinophagales bacterium]
MKHKIILSAFCIFSFCFLANAQLPEINWAKKIHGVNDEFITDIVTDAEGNLYIIGKFYSPAIELDYAIIENTNTTTSDIFLAKYNTEGLLQWVTSIGGYYSETPTDMSIDSKGNISLSGYTYSDEINFGAFNFITDESSGNEFLAQYASDGTFRWVKIFDFQANEFVNCITTDHDDNIYACGMYQTYEDELIFEDTTLQINSISQDIFIAKYRNDGNFIRVKLIQGQGYDDVPLECEIDESGNLILSGIFSGHDITFDDYTIEDNQNNSSDDIFLAKMDPEGKTIWLEDISESSASISDMTTDKSDNIYLSGAVYNNITFDSITLITENSFSWYLVKYNSNAEVQWANIPDYEIVHICADKNNFIYATGNTFKDTIIIGSDTLITNNNSYGRSALIVKYNGSGEPVWAKAFNGSDDDFGTVITSDDFGNIYNAGHFCSDTIIFSEDTLFNLQNDNNEVYFLRTGECNTYKPVISFNDHSLLAPPAESYQWYF